MIAEDEPMHDINRCLPTSFIILLGTRYPSTKNSKAFKIITEKLRKAASVRGFEWLKDWVKSHTPAKLALLQNDVLSLVLPH